MARSVLFQCVNLLSMTQVDVLPFVNTRPWRFHLPVDSYLERNRRLL